MPNKMLIDASHPEETRVVVLRGNRVEEFDFESASKKQLRGNIYLAKVTRVEPSLQAAFVDYGGNRHGFLAFSEIHPDYYQIPVADRQALLEEEARAQRDEEEHENRAAGRRRSRRHEGRQSIEKRTSGGDSVSERIAESSEAEDTAVHDDEDETIAHDVEEVGGNQGGDGFADEHQAEDEAEAVVSASGAVEPPAETSAEAPAAAAPAEHGTPVIAAAPKPADAAPPASAESDAAPAEPPKAAEAEKTEESQKEDAVAAPPPASMANADEPETRAEQLADEAEVPAGESESVELRREDQSDKEDEEAGDEEEDDEEESEPPPVEQIGGDAMEEIPYRPARPRRQYKIQEVIKRRQVLLVQVAKEERGNKGAALTTYLSLAGRYSVLMPNTARGGGISRKITNAIDRKRLKAIAEELEVPEGMGIILRTAGASRTKAEVKRDFEYLLRMWETVRELTLRSTAPTLVYEEGSLIKRAIRDLYNKDIDEVIVAGEEGYREAKEFMRMLIPSHAKNVKPYRDVQPIFARAGAEAQLDAMFTNQVTLKSGGYLVINQTEALVAIDVNSGRATREHNIEDTALRTNLEAADEVARQLRLRDLAGLIVVDFIDMEEGRNNRAVERRMKEALKNDRARIQIGRISHFGLLEMSRQRIRTGVLEGSTVLCPHCMGAGMVRSTSSIALHVLRALEDALIKNAQFNVTVRTRSEVALYILNQKRSHLRELEHRFGVSITVSADATLTGTTYYALERGEPAVQPVELIRSPYLGRAEQVYPEIEEEDEAAEAVEEEEEETGEDVVGSEMEEVGAEGEAFAAGSSEAAEGEDAGRRRRRRRRRRGRERDARGFINPNAPQPSDDGLAVVGEINGEIPAFQPEQPQPFGSSDESPVLGTEGDEATLAPAGEAREPRGRRNRRSRHFNRHREDEAAQAGGESVRFGGEPDFAGSAPQAAIEGPPANEAPPHVAVPPPVPAQAFPIESEAGHPVTQAEGPVPAPSAPPVPETASSRAESEAAPAPETAAPPAEPVATMPPAPPAPDRPKRTGWWQRAKATFGG